MALFRKDAYERMFPALSTLKEWSCFLGSLCSCITMPALFLLVRLYVDVGGRVTNLQESRVDFFIISEFGLLPSHWMG
jgi:hypothetical protein